MLFLLANFTTTPFAQCPPTLPCSSDTGIMKIYYYFPSPAAHISIFKALSHDAHWSKMLITRCLASCRCGLHTIRFPLCSGWMGLRLRSAARHQGDEDFSTDIHKTTTQWNILVRRRQLLIQMGACSLVTFSCMITRQAGTAASAVCGGGCPI